MYKKENKGRAHQTRNAPNIDREAPITSLDDSLRGTILSRLDILSKVLVDRGRVSKV